MRYIRCRTCGRYTELPSASRQVYCSDACAASFERCTNCGRYYLAGSGFAAQTCSPGCSIQYNLQRPVGPLPAEARAEETA